MPQSARTVLVFGIYLVFLGLVVLIAPNLFLSVFRQPPTHEIWIRIVGVLLLGIAFFYLQAARLGVAAFFPWTVYARVGVFISFIAFVLLGLAPSITILFGIVDCTGAIWTALALKAERAAVAD